MTERRTLPGRLRYVRLAVFRNVDRFPSDFMFVLDDQEVAILRCQFGTSRSWGGTRYTPMAFTERPGRGVPAPDGGTRFVASAELFKRLSMRNSRNSQPVEDEG